MLDLVIRGILIGLGATVAMDIWDCIWGSFPGNRRSNWAPIGRWFWHLLSGKVFHKDIADAKPYENEVALGWIGHYTIGATYGVIFALYGGVAWFSHPTFLPVWIWGMITVGAGWFLLQPGLGMGVAACKQPDAWKIRILNIIAHTFFAAGMFGTGWLIHLSTS